MILIIGSVGSGKYEYIRSLGYDTEQIADGVLDDCPVLYHLENMIWADPTQGEALLPVLKEKKFIVCAEVGSGVIPAEKQDRTAREATGRLCVQLAQEADAVIRLCCGIPTAIKGALPWSC